MLILENMQAGLSWKCILNKRENMRRAFDNFDYNKIATYNEDKKMQLLQDQGIIRNRSKINALVLNAIQFKKIQEKFGSFDRYIWGFTNYKQIDTKVPPNEIMPTSSQLSDTISKDLKKRGFKFVGSVIVYSYLQAIGIINDHNTNCQHYKKCLCQASQERQNSPQESFS